MPPPKVAWFVSMPRRIAICPVRNLSRMSSDNLSESTTFPRSRGEDCGDIAIVWQTNRIAKRTRSDNDTMMGGFKPKSGLRIALKIKP